MKKLLSILAATALTSTAATAVVSCGVKPEKNAILILPQETIGATSKDKSTAYEDLANQFNADHEEEIEAGQMAKLEVRWEKSGNIARNIAAKSNLPDLYVFYPDAVSSFAHSGAANQVRDMEASMGKENFEQFEKSLVEKSFIQEGKYEGKQIVLPFGKSVDLSVINVRVLQELAKGFGFDSESKIKEQFNNYNKTERSNLWSKDADANISEYTSFSEEAFKNVLSVKDQTQSKQTKYNAEQTKAISEALKTFEKIVGELVGSAGTTYSDGNIADSIREIFKSTENIKAIATLTTFLYNEENAIKYVNIEGAPKPGAQKEAFDKAVEQKEASSGHFGFSIDSMENKYFVDHAANSGSGNIDISDSNNGFMYNSKLTKSGNNPKTSVEFNKGSESYKHTTEIYQNFKDIAKLRNNYTNDQQNIEQAWKGTFMTKYNGVSGSIYTSSSFQSGTTLLGSGSSAGAYNYVSGSKYSYKNGNKDATGYLNLVKDADILTTSTIGNETNAFMSQGPGIAGFKSNGPNAAEKEKTVSEFLTYIMQPKAAAHFALKTNYMPPTSNAMKIYQKYVEGTYNNKDAFAFEKNKTANIEKLQELAKNDPQIEEEILKIKNAKFLDGAFVKDSIEGSPTNGQYIWVKGKIANIANKEELSLEDKAVAKRELLNTVYDEIEGKKEEILNEETKDNRRFEKYFSPISDYSDANKANSRANVSSINSGYINDFLLKEDSETMLVTSTPSPIGDTFRSGIKSAIVDAKTNTLMYNWSLNFEDLLSDNGYAPHNLSKYIDAKNGSDVLGKVQITWK